MSSHQQQKRPFSGGQNKVYGTYQPIQNGLVGEPVVHKRRSRKPWWVVAGLFVAIPLIYLFVFHVPGMTPKYVPVPILKQVKELKAEFMPSAVDNSRLILIGDVHGMFEPLRDMLNEVGYEHGRDHVVLLGDFISKGEGSLEVLELAMQLNASCVRGNHEDQILGLYTEHYGLPDPKYESGTRLYSMPDELEGDDDDELSTFSTRIRPIDRRIARSLTPEHIDYISTCSATLKLGNITENGYEAVAAHAGLEWQVPELEDMDAWNVMTMRTLLPPDYTKASEGREGSPWANKWNEHMRNLPADQRKVVFYGHDAHAGMNINEFSKGLDTACVKGRSLTAIVVSKDDNGKYTNDMVSVSCAGKR